MKKVFFIFFVMFIVLVVVFFSFRHDKVYEQKKTVVFWTLQLSTFDKYIKGIIAEFEKENPDIKIKWVDVPYSEGEKRTLAAVLTDNPPDLVNLTPDFSLLLAQKNALFTIEEDNLENYLPQINETLKYNGKYFGIPFYATSAVTLYNKTLLKGEPPKNYTELFSSENTTMICLSENDTLLKLLNKYDINSPQNISSQKSIEIFNLLKKFYNSGLMPKESITQTHRDALEKYMSGQISLIVTGANFINMIKENAPAIYKNTEILPQLTGTTGAYDYSLMNFIVPKKAKHPIEAIKFAIFFTNKKNQLEFAKLTTILPVNKDALNDSYFKDISDNNLQTKARIISANQLNNIQQQQKNIKNKKLLNTLSSNTIQEILINDSDIKDTLDKFAQDWNNL